MPIINFAVAESLERQIKQAIKKWGFASKAEFFRFAAIDLINRRKEKELPFENDPEIVALTTGLGQALSRKFKNKKLLSVEEQFKRLEEL